MFAALPTALLVLSCGPQRRHSVCLLGLRENGAQGHDAPVAFHEEPTVLDRSEWQRFRAITERGGGAVSGPDGATPPGAHRGAAV